MESVGSSFQRHCDISQDGHHFLFFVSSTRFSLSSSQCSSSVQRSPPTRPRTDCVQHIQGGCSSSPHSSLRRVSVLLCSFSFVISPCSSLILSFPHATASPDSLCSESAERCMPASAHSTTHSPTSTACWINWQACFETCSFARTHGKLALYCGVIKQGCVHGGIGGPFTQTSAGVSPSSLKKDGSNKKNKYIYKYFQPQPLQLTLHGWVIWRRAKQSCGLWTVRSDLPLFCWFFSIHFIYYFATPSHPISAFCQAAFLVITWPTRYPLVLLDNTVSIPFSLTYVVIN